MSDCVIGQNSETAECQAVREIEVGFEYFNILGGSLFIYFK